MGFLYQIYKTDDDKAKKHYLKAYELVDYIFK